MANCYWLKCVRNYEVVVPESRIMLTRFDGVQIATDQTLPERRWRHWAGETYKARRKAEAESMVRSGNWAWDN